MSTMPVNGILHPNGNMNGYGDWTDRREDYGKPINAYQATAEGPTYEADHLATFTVGSKQGLQTPEDGIRKLRLMDSTTGIWTMRCVLVVTPRHLAVIDKQTGDEIEVFPINLVRDPTAIYNRDRKDIYNNLLVLTVQEDTKKRSGTPTEMHIFQCVVAPAQDAVEAINRSKQVTTSQSAVSYIPPPPRDPAPHPPSNGDLRVRDRISSFNAMAADPGRMRSRREEDAESVLSDRTEKDVQILNHCFDDIETFVGRLQMAAEAYKELMRRKQKRGKTAAKKGSKPIGDGILSRRAHPPSVEEFVDIFKKFKLAFNLLARLQPFIHDPNAPELVHFLFTPLSLIVDASKDPKNSMNDLANRVVSPLLTTEARDLLMHCLTSKESMLWMSLGEAWTLSREQWKGYVPPYYPRFANGWEPYAPSIDEPSKDNIQAAVAAQVADVQKREENERLRNDYHVEDQVFHNHNQQQPQQPPQHTEYNDVVYRQQQQQQRPVETNPSNPRDIPPPAPRPPSGVPVYPPDSDPRVLSYAEPYAHHRNNYNQENRQPEPYTPNWNGQHEDFIRDLQLRNARMFEVIHERTGRNHKELTVSKGEVLECLDDSRNWWKMRNCQGQMGHAPYTILRPYEPDATPTHHVQQPNNNHNNIPGGAFHTENPLYNDRHESMQHQRNSQHVNNTIPVPPPAPPAPPAPPPPVIMSNYSTPRQGKKDDEKSLKKKQEIQMRNPTDDLQNELKQRMTLGRNQNKTSKRASNVYISQNSSQEEVNDWLICKGFSSEVQNNLRGKNGADLFKMSRHNIRAASSVKDEGARLESQILVQKNLCGFNTTGSSELKKILRHRKEVSDSMIDDDHATTDLGCPPTFLPDDPISSNASTISDDVSSGRGSFILQSPPNSVIAETF
ncbi:epidermal growth factor receptor kinase substrate 8-like isoform X2 [Tubulanus polymorphus]|uniref:epidermal growth factor receptor kinase substrate 8-like isoform X2 n=1 Tax=Tubulanus polymorphus TaxID=672921 RepID=UPI003DA46D6B